ncbi:MAG: prepilin peptidase [Terracidiphilus sp.]|nr:prepilin peptidase [Terracidiphilus sp.]
MFRIFGTILAARLGLAFGSFLNVCLSRWPEDESIVHPRSHCRHCEHTLSWWENIPLLSWLILRGRCRSCRTPIGLRYPLVELSIGVLWAFLAWQSLTGQWDPDSSLLDYFFAVQFVLGRAIFYWLLIALAVFDAEDLWLPDLVVLPGLALGFVFTVVEFVGFRHDSADVFEFVRYGIYGAVLQRILAILLAAALILLIRWLYKLIRHREGIGLGDAKLMALLAAWLGLPATLLAFAIGTVLGAIAGLVVIAVPAARTDQQSWATSKLPLGTFLCIGGIISSFWGQPIIAAYLRLAGF